MPGPSTREQPDLMSADLCDELNSKIINGL